MFVMEEAWWESFFAKTFEVIKKELTNHYRLEVDGSGRPEFVAVRKGIERFPPSIKILELKVDRTKFKHLMDDYCPILSYD